MQYKDMNKVQWIIEHHKLIKEYKEIQRMDLSLNMARGVPGKDQLTLSLPMLDIIHSDSDCRTIDGSDCRNYGVLDGIPECKRIMADMIGVNPTMVMVGGNSSLNMMFDTISCFMNKPVVEGCPAWNEVKDRKFLCPAPGYDRHFGITEYFDFEMIPIQMNDDGPDMDAIEEYVKDPTVKGIWCVPKYSNPQGITYSDEVVRRFARLKPAAKDFRIMWDNAYCIHHLTDHPDELLNIFEECEKAGNSDLPIAFCSTSKITFPGSGVAAMAASPNNMKVIKHKYRFQTIGYDKINMLRHVRFFGDFEGMKAHMEKHREILAPRFELVCNKLEEKLVPLGLVSYRKPNGGYFVCVDVMDGTAKRVVALCKQAGVVLTDAGATYPYKNDPRDSNIRIAPTAPTMKNLRKALDVFCICARLAAIERLLSE
ncbi:MAG: aminotransferase [Ruminococcus sp.]|nr:aminotransferase [Ruminococcus sp.]